MPSAMSKTTKRSSRRRTIGVTRPQPTAAIAITNVAFSAAVATVTFDQPVSLNGVPAYTTDLAGVTAQSAAMTSPTTIAVTFSGPVAAAIELRVPYEEPAVRNGSGGFVSTSAIAA